MMKQPFSLSDIALQIINATSLREEYLGVQALSEYLSQIAYIPSNESVTEKASAREQQVSGGIALSPVEAARCLEDYIRTARFIRGSYFAIKELLIRFPLEKIQVLYAGCGPLATLLLPLLPLFKKEQLAVTLLDINTYSTRSVERLVNTLQLDGYIQSIICTDASSYKHPEGKALHMILTETMFYALVREPQVTVTTNLTPQLHPEGLLIPEEITVSMRFGFLASEVAFREGQIPSATDVSQNKEQREIFPVFSLNKKTQSGNGFFTFTSKWFPVPDSYNQCPDVCLLTSVSIFNNILIAPGESLITNPCCVYSLFNIGSHSRFRLHYSCKDIPSWSVEIPGQ